MLKTEKYCLIKYCLIIIFLVLFSIFLFSCTALNDGAKTKNSSEKAEDPFTIFKNSLITSANSNYYLLKNGENIFVIEKAVNINLIYTFTKGYSKNINRYININKLSRKEIDNASLKIFLYQSLDLPFKNTDPILRYVFGQNSIRLNDINIQFRLQNWGGVFKKPDLIVINLNKSKYEDLKIERKYSVLLHEFLHYLFYKRFDNYQMKKAFENSEDPSYLYYISFINETLSYFNGECFLYFIENEESLKLTEDKVKMVLKKLIENVPLSRASKDPLIIVKNYGNNSDYSVLYFFNFANFLIKFKGFETFISFIKYIYSGEKEDLDEIFEIFYGGTMQQIFGLWKVY